MKPINVKTLHKGFLKLQAVTLENSQGETKDFERIIHNPCVVGVCHDPINDMVLLVEQYRYGAMMPMHEFPAGLIDKGEEAHEAITREVLEETGAALKSAQLIQSYMPMPGSMYAPTSLFYCTFDSRAVEDGAVLTSGAFEETKVNLISAKQLIREVEANMHDSAPIVMGAQYLKLLHRGLVR